MVWPKRNFTPPDSASGVLVATVWDVNGKPLAERLIFRQPIDTVQIKITPNAKRYTPGGLAKFDIVTTDAAGEPISAVVGLTVTDDSVLEMVETRDQAPRLPVMVLLEDEVKDLADAQIYFDPNSEDSDLAVDLLLGTQGWAPVFRTSNLKTFLQITVTMHVALLQCVWKTDSAFRLDLPKHLMR